MALVVLAAAVFVVADRGHASGTEGAAALTAAVRTTEQAKTADVALSVTINGAGAGITIAGDGATSFTSAASSLDLTYASAATGERPVTERAVIDGSTGYYDLGPSVGALDPGKSWVSVDLGSASGSAAPGGAGSGSTGSGPGAGAGAGAGGLGGGGIFDDPWSLLAVLGTPGTTANALGSADVDGVAVRRYALALGPAGIARALASQQLPSSVRADLSSTRFQALDYRVSVDGAQHLRQVSTAGSYTVAGEHFSVVSTMDLSAYGTPVRVSPPPASEVVTAQELERLAVQQQGKSIV